MTESDDGQDDGRDDPRDDEAFEALLQYLKESRGFDFTGYKRSSVRRRVERRMQQVEIDDFGAYLDRLQVDQFEFTQLFNTILINVTGFFRDPEAWRELQQEIIPSLAGAKTRGESIRVWSAGCASGEEAYTLAILLAEHLGADEFRRRVKVYATDVDEDALTVARQATYTERDLQGVPEELRERYFESSGSRYTFRGDLRHSVIFGRNDLVQDAPIGRLDLLACRNSLMYLNAETQAQVLRRFHFALNPTGVLFLGKAEMLLSHARLFLPIDLKRRFFRKADQVDPAQRLALAHGQGDGRGARESALEDEALLLNPLATVVVNGDEVVAKANQRAEAQLAVSSREIGRRFPDLDLCGRVSGLRGAYDDVRRNRNPMWLHEVPFSRSATETLYFDVQLVPLETVGNGTGAAVAIFFSDVTRYQRLTTELQAAHRQVETAYEELQSTVEELETTNEELQSTVEELETTNEELQSTVEELETTNEELQSTNDELQSMNDELRDRTTQLDHANDFLESVLGSLRTAVLVVDTELIVRAWNGRADDLWGLRSDETVGQHLLNLDIGLPTEQLRPLVRGALNGSEPRQQELRLEAINRRGRTVSLVVSASPMRLRGSAPTGAIVLMDQDAGPEPALPAPPS